MRCDITSQALSRQNPFKGLTRIDQAYSATGPFPPEGSSTVPQLFAPKSPRGTVLPREATGTIKLSQNDA